MAATDEDRRLEENPHPNMATAVAITTIVKTLRRTLVTSILSTLANTDSGQRSKVPSIEKRGDGTMFSA